MRARLLVVLVAVAVLAAGGIALFVWFKPDGRYKNVYVGGSPGSDLEIGAQLEGSFTGDVVLLTCNESEDREPSLSDNGNEVVFASDRTGNWDIFRLVERHCEIGDGQPEDSTVQQLTTDAGDDRRPAFDRGAGRIAFDSDRSGVAEIYVMDSDGSNVRQLTFSGPNFGPSWSPDGSQIVYYSTRSDDADLFILKLDTLEEERLTDTAAAEHSPAWSPNGESIAFVSEADGNPEIYVLNVSTLQVRQVTNRPQLDLDPVWCGYELCYSTFMDGVWTVFIAANEDHGESPIGGGRELSWADEE